MKTIAIVFLCAVAYIVWLSRPELFEPSARDDNCSFPTISTSHYRQLIDEASQLVSHHRQRIWRATIERDRGGGYSNPVLAEVFATFLRESKSAEDAFVRFHAFGRALNGRIAWLPTFKNLPSAETAFVTFDENGPVAKPALRVGGDFQFTPGLFRRTWYDLILGRILGQRYDVAYFRATYAPPTSEDPNQALGATSLIAVTVTLRDLYTFTGGADQGSQRLGNICPKTASALLRLQAQLERKAK